MVQKPIYLDIHATTQCDPRVVAAMLPYFSETFGNAASTSHRFGWEAQDAVDQAREQVAALVNTDPRNVVFTSGATEASDLANKGLIQPLLRKSGSPPPNIITNKAEHRATLDPIKKMQRTDAAVTILPVDESGRVTP